MVGLIIYCIGAILAFGLLYALFKVEDTKEAGMIVVGTILSWVTVILVMIYVGRKDSVS